MFSRLKRPILALTITAGLLTLAGPASATVSGPKDPASGGNRAAGNTAVVYNGHAGLGANFESIPELDANANFSEVNDEVAVEGFWLGSNDALQVAHAKEPLSFGLSFEHLD
jgi:hypothetical protein